MRSDRPESESLGPCPLCGRPMVAGPSIDRHHLVPRSHGGVAWAHLHRICHSKVHSVFTERELAGVYNTFERLREHDEIARFVSWVRRMHPEYVGRHARRRRGRPPASASRTGPHPGPTPDDG